MQREYPDRPIVGVGAIIVENGRVALIKRGKAPLLGEWSIPGGMLELGETVRQGVEREAMEETGLTVRATELLGVFDRVVRDPDGKTLYHYVLIDFLCKRVSGDLHAAGDASEARWVESGEIAVLCLPKDAESVIRTGIEKSANHM